MNFMFSWQEQYHTRSLRSLVRYYSCHSNIQLALCTIRSHGTKSHMLVSKLHSGTSKTKQLVPVHLDLPLFWKSHCTTCSPACVILYHAIGSCKGLFISSRHRVISSIYYSRKYQILRSVSFLNQRKRNFCAFEYFTDKEYKNSCRRNCHPTNRDNMHFLIFVHCKKLPRREGCLWSPKSYKWGLRVNRNDTVLLRKRTKK